MCNVELPTFYSIFWTYVKIIFGSNHFIFALNQFTQSSRFSMHCCTSDLELTATCSVQLQLSFLLSNPGLKLVCFLLLLSVNCSTYLFCQRLFIIKHGLYGSTSCCISNGPSQWERAIFDPQSSETPGSIIMKLEIYN